MVKQKITIRQPRIRQDKTATISVVTLLELSEKDFDQLNKLHFDSEEATVIIVKDDEYLDFILEEAKRLSRMNSGPSVLDRTNTTVEKVHASYVAPDFTKAD